MPALTVENVWANIILDAAYDVFNSGTLELHTAANVEVATLGFGATAFGASSGASKSLNAMTSDTNATGSVSNVTKCVLKVSGGTKYGAGTVGFSGANVNLTTLIIPAGATVTAATGTGAFA